MKAVEHIMKIEKFQIRGCEEKVINSVFKKFNQPN